MTADLQRAARAPSEEALKLADMLWWILGSGGQARAGAITEAAAHIDEHVSQRLSAALPRVRCRVCKTEKPATQFRKDNIASSGRSNECNDCRNQKRRATYTADPEGASKHNLRNKARRRVGNALRRGILVRPAACERCGAVSKPDSAGRSTIQAHHYNGYESVLDVVWLCPKCHAAEDREARVRKPKLAAADIREIRGSSESASVLAQRHGTGRTTINDIKQAKRWADI